MAEHNPPQDILLRGLRDGIVQPKQTMGRPGLRLSDVVFAAVFKVYSALSGRRAVSGIAECQSKGHIDKTPTYNSTFNYLERTSPLRAVETDFSVDSSGFSTSRFERWYDLKYGRVCSQGQWLKVHLMNGVKTHIVTSAEITASSANDSPHLPALAQATAKRFAMREVSADKGYISSRNLEAIVALGATPYVPFKVNTTGEGPELWRKLYSQYMFHWETFLAHYHKRSNVESVFSMMKAKFGDAIRAESDTAQVNEVLCEVLCHNLCVLIQSMYEVGIEPVFWAGAAAV